MADGTCAVGGCDHFERLKRGWCNMHYQRWRFHGDPEYQWLRPRCSVPDCENPYHCRGYCGMHAMRFRRHGDPLVVLPPDGLLRTTERSPVWVGDEVGYKGAHTRVQMVKGRASEYPCRDCGGTARHWAYDHQDPNARLSPRGLTYSLNVDHYMPLCVSCHRAFDGATRSGR